MQYTVFEITEKVRALFLSILETIARVLWLAARFIANLAEALLRGQVWQAIREGILEQLQTVMGGSGGVLARVTGGGNGLFLVALLLAGLVMVFPLLGAYAPGAGRPCHPVGSGAVCPVHQRHPGL